MHLLVSVLAEHVYEEVGKHTAKQNDERAGEQNAAYLAIVVLDRLVELLIAANRVNVGDILGIGVDFIVLALLLVDAA